MMVLMHLPRSRCSHGQTLALATSAPRGLRQARSRYQLNRRLTILSSLQQKHSQLDPKAPAQSSQEPEPLESNKSEALQKIDNARSSEGEKEDRLLAEQHTSNKEQRKADWAITKEMSRYLWPKVGQTCSAAFQPISDPLIRTI